MTLFGRTFDPQEIFALVSMVLVLVLWLAALRRERPGMRWINWRLMERDREKAEADAIDRTAPRPDGDSKGPWG